MRIVQTYAPLGAVSDQRLFTILNIEKKTLIMIIIPMP